MPKVCLDAAFVRNAKCPEEMKRIEYFDTNITGFVLEVRESGGKTYSMRYRDPYGQQRQQKIGDVRSITFDQARTAAEKTRSRIVLGGNPAEDKKIKRSIPTIAEFYQRAFGEDLPEAATRVKVG